MYFLYNNRIKRELFQVLALVAEVNGVTREEVMDGIRKTFGNDSNMEDGLRRSYSYMDFSMDFSKFANRQTLMPNYVLGQRYGFQIYTRHHSGIHIVSLIILIIIIIILLLLLLTYNTEAKSLISTLSYYGC